jgi:ABC-2 type transport system permease protein
MSIAPAIRPYLAVCTTRFALLLQYRTAAFAGFVTQCWWGVIKIMVFAAFFKSAPHQPMTLEQTITYVWLQQAFLAVLPWNVDAELVQMVESGNVGYERIRPIDTYTYWFARETAWRSAAPLLRCVPMFALAGILLPLVGLGAWSWRLPSSPLALALFAISMALAVLLSASITVLMNVLMVALRTSRGTGVVAGLVNAFSGMIVPLALLPTALQPFLFFQPFAGLVDIPYRIYFANLSGAAALWGLFAQAMWVVILVLIGRAFLARVMARIDMQGG